MKVTTERLPKSLMALEVEPDPAMVERELDRAARRLAQRVTIPGFRKGKAPRFIIESYFGREALLEEATDELINAAFRQALEQEQIEPVGQAQLEQVNQDPFRFRVTIPIEPTITLPDYRSIRVEPGEESVSDEQVQQALDSIRERHVVLQEPAEPRPAAPGDQLTVVLESYVDGELLEQREEGEEPQEDSLVLEESRLLPELFEGLRGVSVGETREITAQVPEDHRDQRVAGKEVLFKITVRGLQERMLPDWEELPTLEEFEGDFESFKADVRRRLEESVKDQARREVINSYIEQLVEATEYDVPDAMIAHQAEHLLERQAGEIARYGITLDQLLQYRGQSREQALQELLPEAERDLKVMLALRGVLSSEGLSINDAELLQEIESVLAETEEGRRDELRTLIEGQPQMRERIASAALDRKLRDRLYAIATGVQQPGAAEPQPDASAERSVEASADLEAPAERSATTEPAADDESADQAEAAGADADQPRKRRSRSTGKAKATGEPTSDA